MSLREVDSDLHLGFLVGLVGSWSLEGRVLVWPSLNRRDSGPDVEQRLQHFPAQRQETRETFQYMSCLGSDKGLQQQQERALEDLTRFRVCTGHVTQGLSWGRAREDFQALEIYKPRRWTACIIVTFFSVSPMQ